MTIRSIAALIAVVSWLSISCAYAQTPGFGFTLDAAGSLTTTQGEVIGGSRSIKGSYSGSGSYTAYLETSSSVQFSPNQPYKVTFSYRILTAPDKGFEVLFFSQSGAAAGSFLSSTLVTGKAGDTGTATLTNTLGNYSDYQVRWDIIGTGVIVIDDIQIINVTTNQVVASASAETPTVTNITAGNLLAPGATSTSITFSTPTATTCGYSVGSPLSLSSMTMIDTGGATTSHTGTITGLSPSSAATIQVYIRCSSDPATVQAMVQYRAVSAANGSFPRVGVIWWGSFVAANEPQAAKVQLYLAGNFASVSQLATLRQSNPNIIALDTINAQESVGPTPPNIPDAYYLKDIHGNKIQNWPGNFLLNLTKPEVADFLAQYAYQRLADTGFAYDGTFFDNFSATGISNTKTDYAGNPIQIDANGDGVADDAATLDAAWTVGINREIATYRKLLPNAYTSSHFNATPTSASYSEFNGAALTRDAVNVRQGFESFSTFLSTYQQWQSSGQAPQITAVQSAPPFQVSYGYGYNPNPYPGPASTVLPSLAEFARTYYPNMRFGLTTALMSNGYSIYDFGDTGSPVAWWYDEYDFDLGQPVGQASAVLGSSNTVYRRDFQNGIVLVNGSATAQTVSLETGFRRFAGTQAPLYQYIVDDKTGAFASSGAWQVTNYPVSDDSCCVASGPYQHAWGTTYQASSAPGATATWNLTIPADGQYTLQAWLPATSSAASWTSGAVYEVLVGDTVVASATLDQTTAKAGDTWHTLFVDLNLTAASNPTLRIRNSSGGTLVADAIYVTSAARYNDGTPTISVTLAPFDGILLQRTQTASSGTTASGLLIGGIFSTSQSASQSFLRFFNTGTSAASVTATVKDYASGQTLGQWSSPVIAPHSEQQFSIGAVEQGAKITDIKPSYYSLSIQSAITGYFQHVLFRPTDGTLTNLSTCASGVTADSSQLSGVHTSLLGNGFPSSIVVTSTSSTAQTVTLGVYDARDGTKLGTYTSASIPPAGELVLTVGTVESGAKITPTGSMYHYVIKVENTFTGYLQHLVNNTQKGVITDMTTACSLAGSAAVAAASPLRDGAVFSTAQSASQSFLRFYNTGTAAGTVTVTLRDFTSGQSVGSWTSPSIPAGAEQQFSISTVETGANITGAKPSYYAISAASTFGGYFQHVLFRPSDGTLTNLSTCAAGITADPLKIAGVHTSTLDFGFPSSIVINNTGAAASTVTLGIYDARDGAKLGTYTSTSIQAGGQIIPTVAQIEAGANIKPTSSMFHYVLKVESAFTGFLQNLVNNLSVGVITDMTTACALNAAG